MLKIIGKWLISLSFVAVGVTHFTDPEPFLAIMPQALPWHLELVYLSGFFEIVGGLGLLFPTTQKRAAWGLLALLVAVFPANINMLVNETPERIQCSTQRIDIRPEAARERHTALLIR
jgi:uncharacterized membrane protein